MDFSAVKEATIPEGKVASIKRNGIVIWNKTPSITPKKLSDCTWEEVEYVSKNGHRVDGVFGAEWWVGDDYWWDIGASTGALNSVPDIMGEAFNTAILVGLSHDTNAITGEKVGLTFATKYISTYHYTFDEYGGSGWKSSDIRNSLMSDFDEKSGVFKQVVKPVLKTTSDSSVMVETTDHFFLPSSCEMFGNDSPVMDGEHYEYFSSNYRREAKNINGSRASYGTRTTIKSSGEFYAVYRDGTSVSFSEDSRLLDFRVFFCV